MRKKNMAKLTGVILVLLMANICFSAVIFAQSTAELIDRGLDYYNRGNYDQAISDFNRVLGMDPNNDAAYFNRGLAYRKRGIDNNSTSDTDRAIADFNRVIEMYPNHPKISEVYLARANAYHDKDNLDYAISDYNRAIEKDPYNALAFENRGLINFKKNDISQAVADYSRAIQLNPSKSSLYTDRGTAYVSTGENDSLALSDFNKALQLDSNDAGAYYGRAIVYFYMQEYDKAWNDVRKAEALGYSVPPEIIESLKEVTGG